MDQMSITQTELQTGVGSPQLSVLRMEENNTSHKEHQEDYFSSSAPFVSVFDVKVVDDEEDTFHKDPKILDDLHFDIKFVDTFDII